MSVIYLVSDFGKLSKKNNVFHFAYPDGTSSTFFPYNTEQIVCIGQIEVSAPAMKMLMHHKIDVVFVSKNGRFDGRLSFAESKNVMLRRNQFMLLDNERFVLEHCRTIVKAKLLNQYNYMLRIRRERKGGNDFVKTVDLMKANIDNLEHATSPDAVRGYEGLGSRLYFSVFKHNILPEWATFNGRSMNPPLDNVNAVLSFLYTLMAYRIESAIAIEGLDPYAGYLHSLAYGRKSLVFDLVEEYRTPICDMLTAVLFNMGTLDKDNFRQVDFSNEDDDLPIEEEPSAEEDHVDHAVICQRKGVLLDQTGLRKVIATFEKKLDSKVFYTPARDQISFRKIIREQTAHYRRVINGEEACYVPLVMK